MTRVAVVMCLARAPQPHCMRCCEVQRRWLCGEYGGGRKASSMVIPFWLSVCIRRVTEWTNILVYPSQLPLSSEKIDLFWAYCPRSEVRVMSKLEWGLCRHVTCNIAALAVFMHCCE
ncbi:hypothetical protein LOAG_07435 [Loa loa]|uniref:Uncharacterized protein n=1 Tax=Loa loa TaxID=7209 RepID=A0A1S0TXA9_LOALO|nr:hypothetical protein LOAG_07435 [Loa loa]EFO21054.1 hypothetical protein LOAG_07435 [Loa loa]